MIGVKVPVFVVNGFLESGKTVFCMDTIEDEYFSDGEDTLIIACEEGMEEYDEGLLERHGSKVIYCDSKEEFTEEFLKNAQKTYKPSQILLEYNGMWGMELLNTVKKPRGWFRAQQVTMVDATTYHCILKESGLVCMFSVHFSKILL